MILKYISFLIGLTWSYSLIKTQSIFSKKAGLIFKVFISKVSWLTFLAAIYFGYKNFTIEYILIGIVISIASVHVGFIFLAKFLKKTMFSYSLATKIGNYLVEKIIKNPNNQ